MNLLRPTLLFRIFLSTAVAMTCLFAIAGWLLLRQASQALQAGVEEELRGSLASVEALWRAKGELMRSSSSLLSTMSDVRSAFGTKDPRTIQDTAAEIWARSGSAESLLLVAGPYDGKILATIGDRSSKLNLAELPSGWLSAAQKSFPKQATGFALSGGMLWQVVVTPVYVDTSSNNLLLLNMLLAVEPIGVKTLERLQRDTAGTGFVLKVAETVVANTPGASLQTAAVSRPLDLKGIDDLPLGTLFALRPLDMVNKRVDSLRQTIVLGWIAAMFAGLLLSFWLTRRITSPIAQLGEAALAVSREDYSVRVSESSGDELGLLGKTFNRMCESIHTAREELIRREQIHTAGRLAASIAHDLRNPLSAVTAGAEMIAEMNLSLDQARSASKNIYSAALRMQQMLEELSQSVGKKSAPRTIEDLGEIVQSALQSQHQKLEARNIEIVAQLASDLPILVERGRFERVIINLLSNAIDVLPKGGVIRLEALRKDQTVTLHVRDNGPGIPLEIRPTLFQPFVTQGKASGLGLGLALSRQTMIDHGGDLESIYNTNESGACFQLQLPIQSA